MLDDLQSKPNLFQVEAWALPPLDQALACGWFNAAMPTYLAPEGNLLASDVWATVAGDGVRQGRLPIVLAFAMLNKRGAHGNPEVFVEMASFGTMPSIKLILQAWSKEGAIS